MTRRQQRRPLSQARKQQDASKAASGGNPMSKTTLFILLYITIGVFIINIAANQMEKSTGQRLKASIYILLIIAWPLVFYCALLIANKRRGK